MSFTGIPAVSADAVSALHEERAKRKRGGNRNRLFKMLLCWYRGRHENESDMIRLRAVLETCLQDGDEDLLQVCGDELGWVMREKKPLTTSHHAIFPSSTLPPCCCASEDFLPRKNHDSATLSGPQW